MPIGLPEIIETASADDLRGFYERWYRPDLMAVVAVGDFDPGEIEAMIREHFAPPPEGAAAYPRATRPDSPTERPEFSLPLPPYEDLPHHIATDPDMSSLARLEIYCKRPADRGHDLASYRRMLVDSLFVAKTEARLAEVGGQPGSTYRRGHAGREHLVSDTAALRIAVDVDKDQIGDWIVLASILLREGVTDDKLETEKRNLLRAMDSAVRERDQRPSAQLAVEYLQHFLYGKMVPGVEAEYDLHQQILPEITVAEVSQVAESCPDLRDMVILVAGPEDMDHDAMRGQIDEGISYLNDLLNGSSPTAGTDDDQRSVGRVDLTFDQFAEVFVVPEPGTIDAEERIESIDARRWTLSNGVTVIAKQTDFRNDEVQLTATSPGGHSLVADADYISAQDAVDVVKRSGLAINGHRFWPDEKLIKPYIDELFEGFSGQSSPEDLETLLQFMRLYATATPWARTDQSVYTFHYDSLLSQWSRDFEEWQSQPDTALIEAYVSAVTQDHFRTALRTFQEETSLEGVEAVYAERFGDLGDFTFIIVGAFDWDELRSLAVTYLATLPAAGRDETWRDLGIDPPPGVVERIVYRGIEERSSTIIAFVGDMEWSPEAEMELQALGEMLQIRLRERLREELGGTYSIFVGASGSALPDPEFQVMVRFSSDPARADELFEEVLIGVDWARDGAEQSYLDKAKKILLSNREEQLRRNDFWLDQIRGAVERREPFESIVGFDERLDALTLEQVTEAARRYLSRDRYVRVVRLPEESESDSQ